MSFIVILLMIFEWVWCVLMPIIGSIHLVSSRYHQENANKDGLFKHWCYYWIIYFILRIICSVLNIFLYKLEILFYALRILILCVIVTPKTHLTETITEKILSKSDTIKKMKDECITMFNKKILHRGDKKED